MVWLLQAAYGQEMVAQHGDDFNWRGVHAARVEMVYPTIRKMFQYTFVGLVICQSIRCGRTMARKCLKMYR
jgi:hypothetical protein